MIYHDTFTSAVQFARDEAEKRGFVINGDSWFRVVNVGTGRPKPDQTFRGIIQLEGTKKCLHIQVYNMNRERFTYELNFYIS